MTLQKRLFHRFELFCKMAIQRVVEVFFVNWENVQNWKKTKNKKKTKPHQSFNPRNSLLVSAQRTMKTPVYDWLMLYLSWSRISWNCSYCKEEKRRRWRKRNVRQSPGRRCYQRHQPHGLRSHTSLCSVVPHFKSLFICSDY